MKCFRREDMKPGAYFAAFVERSHVVFGRLAQSLDKHLLRPQGTCYRAESEIRSFSPLDQANITMMVRNLGTGRPLQPVNVDWLGGCGADRQEVVWRAFKGALPPNLATLVDSVTYEQPFGGLGAQMRLGRQEIGLGETVVTVVGVTLDYGRVFYQLEPGPRLPSQPNHEIAAISRRWSDDRDAYVVHFRSPLASTETHQAVLI